MGKATVRGSLSFGRNGRCRVYLDDGKEFISLARGASGTGLHGDLVELYSLPPKKKIGKKKVRKQDRPGLRFEKFSNVQPMSF